MAVLKLIRDHPIRELLLLPFLPIIFLVGVHDATVSVLRSYSMDQLSQLLQECLQEEQKAGDDSSTPAADYNIEKFEPYSFAGYFRFLPGWFNQPRIQFFVASPP